uniref:uncharacterized protein LOC117713566 n=1 Tax=Arvicanthis niloticus TaxID=61156 RepID=UPI001486416C|nr:uncharacterized protein LOC117713566 [Arvicanthis niloticus]
MDLAMDMSIAIMCGVGLFILLLPFLKEYPVSLPPESERDILKDVKREQKETGAKSAAGEGYRDGGNTMEETKTPSRLKKNVTKQHVEESTAKQLWDPTQKLDHLPLSQLLFHLKVLEDVIQNKLIELFWGISFIFSESVVATAHVFRNPFLGKHKSVRFIGTSGPAQAPPQAKGPPQHSRYQPLSHQPVKPKFVSVKPVQEKEILPSSTPKQISPCLKCRTCAVSCPTTERRIQASLPTECLLQKQGMYSKIPKSYVDPNHLNPIRKYTGNLPRVSLDTKAIRPASILTQHCRMLQHHKEQQATTVGEQQGTPIRFLPSRKLTQLQGQSHYSNSRPQLSQPAQPSFPNPESCNCSKKMGPVPTGLPLQNIRNSDLQNIIKEGLCIGAKKVAGLLCSTSGNGLKLRNTALRTDKLSDLSLAEHPSPLNSKTERKLASDSIDPPGRDRRRPYSPMLEARDVMPPGLPYSNLPQAVCPSSSLYKKTAPVLGNLHHRDPGGTLLESAPADRKKSAVFMDWIPEVPKTKTTPPPAASHEASKAHPDPCQRYLNVHRPAFYFQVENPQQTRTIRGTGKGSLQPCTPAPTSQGERLGRVKPSISPSTQLKDITKTCITGKGESTSKSSWKNIPRNDFRDRNHSTTHSETRDKLKNVHPPASNDQTQKFVKKTLIINNMLADLQSLANVLFQMLEDTKEDPSKREGCKEESLMFQQGDSSQSSESLHNTNHSRGETRMSCGHANPKMHYQLPIPKGKELPCGYRGILDKQEPGLVDLRACGAGKIRPKVGMTHCQHRSPEGHKQSLRNREIGNKQQPGVDHTAFDPHQSTTKGMGCGCFLSPEKNHPVKHLGNDYFWSSAVAQ